MKTQLKCRTCFKVYSHGQWVFGSLVTTDDAQVALYLDLPSPGMKERDTQRQTDRKNLQARVGLLSSSLQSRATPPSETSSQHLRGGLSENQQKQL